MSRLHRFLLLAASLFLGWAAVPAYAQEPEVEMPASEMADRLVDYAATFLGTPYRYGANGPKRFDCTGYTRYVYKKFGYTDLSRSSRDQARDGREVDISDFHNLQKGDILVLGSRHNPKVVGHVGIFIGLDSTGRDPMFIHASNHGVRYSTLLTESYYSHRLLGARRVLPDFYDYDVDFDTTAVYAFDPSLGVHIAPDSLVLAETDRRIVLFENGKWAFVGENGQLVIPEAGDRIILSGDGNWAPVREAKVIVPSSALQPDPEQPELAQIVAPADTVTSHVANVAVQPAQAPQGQEQAPEMVYHTIKKGDTLYGISRQYGTSINKICQLNNITTSTILKVGRKLRVK